MRRVVGPWLVACFWLRAGGQFHAPRHSRFPGLSRRLFLAQSETRQALRRDLSRRLFLAQSETRQATAQGLFRGG